MLLQQLLLHHKHLINSEKDVNFLHNSPQKRTWTSRFSRRGIKVLTNVNCWVQIDSRAQSRREKHKIWSDWNIGKKNKRSYDEVFIICLVSLSSSEWHSKRAYPTSELHIGQSSDAYSFPRLKSLISEQIIHTQDQERCHRTHHIQLVYNFTCWPRGTLNFFSLWWLQCYFVADFGWHHQNQVKLLQHDLFAFFSHIVQPELHFLQASMHGASLGFLHSSPSPFSCLELVICLNWCLDLRGVTECVDIYGASVFLLASLLFCLSLQLSAS